MPADETRNPHFQRRLSQLRAARGLTLEALAAAMGGIVTKQAISKYERGLAMPTLRVLAALARAFDLKTMDLLREPEVEVEVLAFRKTKSLGKREQEQAKQTMVHQLEQRVRLQRLADDPAVADIPVRQLRISSIEDTECAAADLRERWHLGTDPLANVTDALEEHHVHVVELSGAERLDGLAAVATDTTGTLAAAAVASRAKVAGERQRLSLAHELGHLVMKPDAGVAEEKAAFRFAGAFLAPGDTLRRDVGSQRSNVTLSELLLLKMRYGMSVQALVYRLRDLEVITESQATRWWKTINAQGWKQHEPRELPAERPQWVRRSALRAVAEGLLSAEEAAVFTGEKPCEQAPGSLLQRRAFLRLGVAERRRMLGEEAQRLTEYYATDVEWRNATGGDVVDE